MEPFKLALPDANGFIPLNTVYTPRLTKWNSTLKLNYYFVVKRFSLLKMLQQICIVLGALFHLLAASTKISFILYSISIFILLPTVHVMMWLYLMHRIEKSPKYPWYKIEYIIGGTGAVLCTIISFFPLYSLLLAFSVMLCFGLIFDLAATFLFIFNYYLVKRITDKELPLQGSELTEFAFEFDI